MSLIPVAYYNNYNENYVVSRRKLNKSVLHSHTFHEIELIVSGEGAGELNGKSYSLKRGCLFFTSPGDVHRITAKNGKIDIFNISFIDCGESFSRTQVLFYSTKRIIYLSEDDTDKFIKLLSIIESEQNRKGVNLFKDLCFEAALQFALQNSEMLMGDENNYIFKALIYIQNNFKQEINLKTISEYVGFSEQYFSAAFRKTVGITFKQYLTNIRVAYAKKLMSTTDMRCLDICYEAGFNSYSSFLRAFKGVALKNPSKKLSELRNE